MARERKQISVRFIKGMRQYMRAKFRTVTKYGPEHSTGSREMEGRREGWTERGNRLQLDL
jgi:hypothetical protein